MGDPKGFLKTRVRETTPRRPIPIRLMDWREVYEPTDQGLVKRQAGRCMDCGIAFCHPRLPPREPHPGVERPDLARGGNAGDRAPSPHEQLPEFTGKLCPAPCESSCVLGINQPAVTIKLVEASIIEQAWQNGWVQPHPPERLTGKTVAIVGSGPAGLAAAQQLTRAGHTVAVFERDDRIGGLLRYGIPDFKMEKKAIDQRIAQMQAEGTRFRAGVEIGVDITWGELRERYDAVLIATGATVPRDLAIPGRDLLGVHFAMDYLVQSNKAVAGDQVPGQVSAEGKHVIVIGGGDTGADCIGTAHRQGALSVTNLAIGKQPPSERPSSEPWPMMPHIFEISSAHEEGGERVYPRVHGRVHRERGRRGHRAARRGDRVRRRPSRPEVRHRARDPRRPRAHRDGVHGTPRRTRSRTSSRSRSATAGPRARRRLRDEQLGRLRRRRRPAAASRSSSGRSPKGEPRPRRSTRSSRASPSSRCRSRRPTGPSRSDATDLHHTEQSPAPTTTERRPPTMRRAKIVATLGRRRAATTTSGQSSRPASTSRG